MVTGSRDWSDAMFVYDALDRVLETQAVEIVIHGQATGADRLAGRWARHRGIGLMEFPALWESQGKPAGVIRNQRMMEYGKPDYFVAFVKPTSVGTWDMVRRASAAGIPGIVYDGSEVIMEGSGKGSRNG